MAAPVILDFSQTITIAKDASLSGAIDLKGATCLGFICPAAIEATTVELGFFASDTLAGTYTEVKRNGLGVILTFAVNDYALMPNPEDLVGVRFLKIQTQTAVPVAVAQATAARTFKVIKKIGL